MSPAFEHLLYYGNMRLTDEELARAVRLDPSQIRGLGPSLDALRQCCSTSGNARFLTPTKPNTSSNEAAPQIPGGGADQAAQQAGQSLSSEAVREEQLHDLERLWYRAGDETAAFARQLLQLVEGWARSIRSTNWPAKYEFTGRTAMTIPKALEIKEELETIDKLLKQLEEAAKTAQIGIIDMEELAQFAEPGDIEQLGNCRSRSRITFARWPSSRDSKKRGTRLSDDAQGLSPVPVEAADADFRSSAGVAPGRHQGPIVGEGATEMQQTGRTSSAIRSRTWTSPPR